MDPSKLEGEARIFKERCFCCVGVVGKNFSNFIALFSAQVQANAAAGRFLTLCCFGVSNVGLILKCDLCYDLEKRIK